MVLLTEDYIISKFYQYAGNPRYNRLSKSYNGGCPTCREGTSWGKKRRLYYVTRKNLIFCHNCGLSMRPAKWIQSVSGLTYGEVLKENSGFQTEINLSETNNEPEKIVNQEELPLDPINLLDPSQVSFYSNDSIIKDALSLVRKRRLDTAVNRPKTLWISLKDKIHRDRLVVPFYDIDEKIVHYQSRTIRENKYKKFPKYLSKLNSEKSLFGINSISEKIPYLFITEGPIDAFFIENGIAVAGINESSDLVFTDKQKSQIAAFPLHEKIWILDNQRNDKASKKKTNILLKKGYKVFIWPEKTKHFKDLNEMAINLKIDKVSTKFILENTFSGIKGSLLLSNLD